MPTLPTHPDRCTRRGVKVLKFGGTSVGSASALRRAVAIIGEATRTHRVVTVVSALSGVTDLLSRFAEHAGRSRRRLLERLLVQHRRLAEDVLSPEGQAAYAPLLAHRLEALRRTGREPSPWTPADRDAVLAIGERLSAPLLVLALQDAGLAASFHDAATLICTDGAHGEAGVDLPCTQARIRAWHDALHPDHVAVVPGFIGASGTGQTTTLGRGGSDYSAALIAGALRAQVMERWTDVDALFTDDPRRNPAARPLARLSLSEALALNEACRLGMHRRTIAPLHAAGIPLHVRSTAAPGPGTLIVPDERPPNHADR